MQPPQPARPRRSAGWAYLIVVLVALLPAFVLTVLSIFGGLITPKGYCGGFGFGCVHSLAFGAQLFLFLVAPPVAVVQIALSCGILALLRLSEAYRRRPVSVQGLIVAIPMILLLAAVVIVLLI